MISWDLYVKYDINVQQYEMPKDNLVEECLLHLVTQILTLQTKSATSG